MNHYAQALAELLRDVHEYIGTSIPHTVSEHYRGCDLLDRIDAVLAGKVPDHIADAGKIVPEGYLPIRRSLLEGLVSEWNAKGRGRSGSPNHGHSTPGVWDSDNGLLANQPCAQCAMYDEARELLAAAPKPQGSEA